MVPWERATKSWYISGLGGPGVAPPAKTNNSPDLREEKQVDARGKEIGGEEGDKKDVRERDNDDESRLALAHDATVYMYA